jgi:hypothetical protein
MQRTLFLAAGLALLASCNPAPTKTAAGRGTPAASRGHVTPTPLVLLVTGHGTAQRPVHVFQQVHNRVEYDLLASSYESKGPPNGMRSVFSDARATFVDPHGARIVASAPQAVVDQNSDAVTMTGGVAARTSTGMTLHCDRLVYRRGGATLHGDGNVVITDPKGFRATGSSFDSDISLTHMRMQ